MSSLSELADLLGVPEKKLAMLSGLGQENLAHLRDSINASVAEQEGLIQKGIETGLKVVPSPLRGRARAILFPGGQA